MADTKTTDLAMVTPALIFNATLAHHLFAHEEEEIVDVSSNDENQKKTRMKAKKLYQLAHIQADPNINPLFDFVVLRVLQTEQWYLQCVLHFHMDYLHHL